VHRRLQAPVVQLGAVPLLSSTAPFFGLPTFQLREAGEQSCHRVAHPREAEHAVVLLLAAAAAAAAAAAVGGEVSSGVALRRHGVDELLRRGAARLQKHAVHQKHAAVSGSCAEVPPA
jgi:hypothetical protein